MGRLLHVAGVSERTAVKRPQQAGVHLRPARAYTKTPNQRSHASPVQVGACIVDQNQVILGIGYNGFPRGCSDVELPWSKKAHRGLLGTKYPYVVHAEANALLNKNAASVEGAVRRWSRRGREWHGRGLNLVLPDRRRFMSRSSPAASAQNY